MISILLINVTVHVDLFVVLANILLIVYIYAKGGQHGGRKALSGNLSFIWLLNYLSFSLSVSNKPLTYLLRPGHCS